MAKGWGKNQELLKEGKRFCSKCCLVLSLDSFHTNKAHEDGWSSWCKKCTKPVVKEVSWRRKLMHHYGMTPPQYYDLLAKQEGVCAICKRPPDDRRLAVDHCHKSNKVRGLLCFHCNTLLGHGFDKAEVLTSAIAYLNKYYDPDFDLAVVMKKLEANGAF